MSTFCPWAEMNSSRRRPRASVEAPIEVARGEEVAGLERAVAVLERYVAEHTDQWFNFFDVWDGPAGD